MKVRSCFAEVSLQKLAKFWPVVGLLGLRQVGKTTLMNSLLTVDLIWNDVPVKVIAKATNLGWEERSLSAAMKKLRQKQGVLVAPVNKPHLVQNGISIVPWSYWS